MVASAASFPESFQELVRACSSFYKDNLEKLSSEHVRQTRSKLSGFGKVFHKQCGTLTSSVKERLEALEDGNCVVLMTAHQPNFFPYSGVLRKATLNFLLAQKLEESLRIPVVNFFGIADQDFADDRWVRSCQLPAVLRRGGVLSIEAKLPERMMLSSVAKPSRDWVDGWKARVEKWLDETIKSVMGLSKKLGPAELFSSSSFSALHQNLEMLWSVVDDCFDRSERYSDFNAFIMSKIANDLWGYDTVFARFSECQRAFTDEFCFLLSRFKDYSHLLGEAQNIEGDETFGGGVSDQEPLLVPFWYHCDCGSKVKLFLTEDGGVLFGKGNCVNCQRYYNLEFGSEDNLNVSSIASRISARAIPTSLIFFGGLVPSCYVGGIAGKRYLEEARHVAKGLGMLFPPVAFWRPHDRYAGVGQVEALLELRCVCHDLGAQNFSEARDMLMSRISKVRGILGEIEVSKNRIVEELRKNPDDQELKRRLISVSMSQTETRIMFDFSASHHELKVVDNALSVSSLIPSIIDYAVNVGLKETSNQWIRHLTEKDSLESDVLLESVLSRNESWDSRMESSQLL
jgi:hypothetical protein